MIPIEPLSAPDRNTAIILNRCANGHEWKSMMGAEFAPGDRDWPCMWGIKVRGQFEPFDYSEACMADVVSSEVIEVTTFDDWHKRLLAGEFDKAGAGGRP